MRTKKTLRRIIIFFLGILSVIALLGILFFVSYFGTPWDWSKNNNNLERFSQQFYSVPLPARSSVVGKKYKNFGLLVGNSNYCDYEAAYLLKTSLSQQEIQAHFDQYSVAAVDPDMTLFYTNQLRGHRPNEIVVLQEWENNPAHDEDDMSSSIETATARYGVEPEIIQDNVYEITVLDYGYSPNDLRCS